MECKVRDRLEERLEVILFGVVFLFFGFYKFVLIRFIISKGSSINIFDGIVVGESKRYCFKSSK